MVKTLAEAHGLRATFMPKPFAEPLGQRLPRARLGVGRRAEQNLFRDRAGELGLSRTGVRVHRRACCTSAEALCAITNPTVNSFKRINGAPTALGRHLVAQHHQLHAATTART